MERNDFDAGNVHYDGSLEGLGPEIKTFGTLKWQERSECHLGLVVYNVTLHTLPPPPHPNRALYGTIKKSTAPYKVHNICLQYIKTCMHIFYAAPLFKQGLGQGHWHYYSIKTGSWRRALALF